MWNYSNMPFNIDGQICLPFTLIWCIISVIVVVLDDYLRYLFLMKRNHITRLYKIIIGILYFDLYSVPIFYDF
ncbi:MAG: hypothetical protein ACI4DS_07195 [Eubacterium sp.]